MFWTCCRKNLKVRLCYLDNMLNSTPIHYLHWHVSSMTWKPTVQMAEYMKLRLCTLDTLEQNVWLFVTCATHLLSVLFNRSWIKFCNWKFLPIITYKYSQLLSSNEVYFNWSPRAIIRLYDNSLFPQFRQL